MRLDLFVQLKYESSTIISFVGIRYSASDLLYLKISFFHLFSFLVFRHDFIRCFDFTRVAAPNTANDDVTN